MYNILYIMSRSNFSHCRTGNYFMLKAAFGKLKNSGSHDIFISHGEPAADPKSGYSL